MKTFTNDEWFLLKLSATDLQTNRLETQGAIDVYGKVQLLFYNWTND